MSNALIAKSFDLPVAVESVDAYIQRVNAFPVLDAEEERALAVRLHQQHDLGAARQLIVSHLRYVVHIARGYLGYGLPLNDLIQEGNIGLMKAVRRFDPERQVRLISFAVHWIRAEIHEFILRNWRIVKVATTKAQRKLFFNLRGAKQRLGWLSSAEAEAVAEDLGVDPREVVEMESRLSGHDVSYDPDPQTDDEDSVHVAPSTYLADTRFEPASSLEADDWEEQAVSDLAAAMERLDPRSRDILQRRWLSERKATLQQLAAEYGVSAERIRQIESSAMKKVRAYLPAP